MVGSFINTRLINVVSTSELVPSIFGFGMIYQNDIQHSIGVIVGLVVGTFAAYVWEDQTGKGLPKRWLFWQVGMWGLIWVVSLFVAEWFDFTNRAVIAFAAGCAFLGRDLIDRARKRTLKHVDDAEIE